jgi:hypothetical protein
MAKLTVQQSSLNGGEISPLLHGRMDIPRYQSGLELCRNALPKVTGGVSRRAGSMLAATEPAFTVLLPFRPIIGGKVKGYGVELSDLAARFVVHRTPIETAPGVRYEIVTPYTEAQLRDVVPQQIESTLYLFHPDHFPRRLIRNTDTDWTLEAVPFYELPQYRPVESTLLSMQLASNVSPTTMTTTVPFFEDKHVGAVFHVLGGLAEVTAITSPTVAEVDIVGDFPTTIPIGQIRKTFSLAISAGLMTIPAEFVFEGASKSALGLVYKLNPISAPAGITVTAVFTHRIFVPSFWTVTVNIDPAGLIGDEVFEVSFECTGVSADLLVGFSGAAAGVVLTQTEATFETVGITPDFDWTIDAWSPLFGYPRTATAFEQRLVMGSTYEQPLSWWTSGNGNSLNVIAGTLDDAPITASLAAGGSQLHHLIATNQLLALLADQEFTIKGSNDAALTPTNIQIRGRTGHGTSSLAKPVKSGDGDVLFVGFDGKSLRSFRYSLTDDDFVAPDIAIVAEHLLGAGLVGMVWTRSPQPSIWAWTVEGWLVSLVYDRTQEVIAWSRHYSDASETYLSAAVWPDENGTDRVWVTVERTVNGVPTVFLEYFDEALQVDCGLIAESDPATDTWAVAHLEGMTVDVVADGFVHRPVVVAGGQIVLDYPAASVQIGLHYKTIIKDLPPYLQGATGAAATCKGIRVLLHESQGCTINGEEVPFAAFSEVLLDQPLAPFTGWKKVGTMTGWGTDGTTMQVTIEQDVPLPLTVLSIVKEIAVNNG